MPKRKIPAEISVVAINPKTGKVIRSPKTRQAVQYAIRGKRGALSLLRSEPQPYFKTDARLLNRDIKNTGGKNFIVHEQRTRQVARYQKNTRVKQKDGTYIYHKKGDIIYNKDGSKRKAVKITGAQPRRKQRPTLYINKRPRRELDMGYKKGNYARIRQQRKLLVAKPNTLEPVKIVLQGDTIKQALEGLQVDVSFQNLMTQIGRLNLFYSVILKIYPPKGEVIIIPINGSAIIDGFPGFPKSHSFMNIPKDGGGTERKMAMQNQVQRMSNLKTEMAFSIRRALKDSGYRFTSLAKLKQLAARNDMDFRSLKNIGTYPKKLTQLTPKYKVVMYVRFEVM